MSNRHKTKNTEKVFFRKKKEPDKILFYWTVSEKGMFFDSKKYLRKIVLISLGIIFLAIFLPTIILFWSYSSWKFILIFVIIFFSIFILVSYPLIFYRINKSKLEFILKESGIEERPHIESKIIRTIDWIIRTVFFIRKKQFVKWEDISQYKLLKKHNAIIFRYQKTSMIKHVVPMLICKKENYEEIVKIIETKLPPSKKEI